MAMVESYEKEVKSIKKNILEMCWHMRGGLTYTEAMNMSVTERQIIAKMVEDHIETTKKSGLPYF
jgi:hypothetical protein